MPSYTKIVLVLLLVPLMGCAEKKPSNNQSVSELAIILGALVQQPKPVAACTSSFSCNSAPSFSSLSSAGTASTCANAGCHSTASQVSGLDITDFNSAKAFTNPGNACSSRMYTSITTGSMAGNTNSKITEAVFCWIAGGSNR